MKVYSKITIFENRRRRNDLFEFRYLVVQYFNNTTVIKYGTSIEENDIAAAARTKINLQLEKCYLFIVSAGISPYIFYTPASSTGGIQGNINLIHNMFNLYKLRVEPIALVDCIERAIGIYDEDKYRAIIRTINPFYWIGMVFDYISSLPFRLIGKFGFNEEKLQSSFFGKIIKSLINGILYLIIISAALLTVFEKLGHLEKAKSMLNYFIKFFK